MTRWATVLGALPPRTPAVSHGEDGEGCSGGSGGGDRDGVVAERMWTVLKHAPSFLCNRSLPSGERTWPECNTEILFQLGEINSPPVQPSASLLSHMRGAGEANIPTVDSVCQQNCADAQWGQTNGSAGVWSRGRFTAGPHKEDRWFMLKQSKHLDGFWGEVFIGRAWGGGWRVCDLLLSGWWWGNRLGAGLISGSRQK